MMMSLLSVGVENGRSMRSLAVVPVCLLLSGWDMVAQEPVAAAPEVSFDVVAEKADAWQRAEGRATVALDVEQTHGTKQSLHMRWNKDLGDMQGKGTHSTPIVPFCWVPLPDDLDLSTYTEMTYWVKIGGGRHGHLHLAFSSEPRLWGKGVIRTHNNTPLDAGDWRQYRLVLGHIAAAERKAYRWFGIASINVGHQPGEAAELDVWLDDFVLSSKPLRPHKGWDADPSVVIVSQLGFRRLHQKLAVANVKNTATEFAVREAGSGREAFAGKLSILKSAVGTYKTADFTRLTAPGRYLVEAGDVKSLTFSIGDDAYAPCIELLSDWVFNMRCGCKTALHDPCHTDDGTLVWYEGDGKEHKELRREHLDVVGGWHDAGDVRTYYSYTFWLAHQMLRSRECGWLRDRDNDGVDDLMDSALWGMRHLPKIRHPDDGRFFFKIADWPDYRRGNYWTDCETGTHDDRHVMDFRGSGAEADPVGRACASAGLFARTASPAHREVAERALQAARERWAVWFDPDTGRKRWREEPIHVHRHGYHIAKWGQGSLQLYLATQEPVYLEFAQLCAGTIMGYQRRTFYRGGAGPMCGEIFSWLRTLPDRDLPEEYLADLMIELSDSAEYYKWRATLVRAANWWMKPVRRFWRPFCVPQLEVPKSSFGGDFFGVPLAVSADEGTTHYLVPTAGGIQLPDTAHGIQRVAQALNDIELERLARWQVQWTVGHNPFNVSWVCDFGEDSIDQYYSFSQGRMPGCVSTGFGIGNNGVPGCVRPGGGETWTTSAARLLRALIAVSEPARLRLRLRRGTEPWQRQVVVRWSEHTREPVAEATPDGDGVVNLTLDGGQRYELVTGGVSIPLALVSGTRYDRTIDLDRVLVLSAKPPDYVMSKHPFAVELTVENRGLAPVSTAISVYAEDAGTQTATQMVSAPAGKNETVSWPFTAGEGNRPYVLFFEPDGDRLSGLDVTGEILP